MGLFRKVYKMAQLKYCLRHIKINFILNKGIVHSKVKHHPFTTHTDGDEGSVDIF